MLPRLITRLFWSGVTLVGTAVLTFLLTHFIPGDVARVIAGPKASPEVIQAIHQKLHLDEPAWKRLGFYLGQVATGDLGQSYVTEQPVLEAIHTRFPTTATIVVLAITMWMAMAVPLGVLTASRRGSWIDRSVLVGATLTLSLPAFWLARMLQYWLAYRWGWFPVAGHRGLGHLMLPSFALALLAVGYYARLIHTNLVGVLDLPFIRAARARGIPEHSVLWRHGLRNALIPVLTVLGMDVAFLLGGVVFVENVFALPGIGTLAVQSVFNLDVPMIMGVVLFTATMVVASNLLVDLAYGWIDPRIRATH